MVSVVIIFWDRDFFYVPRILEQVEKFLKIPHEVITINNCGSTPDEQLGFEPTFSFGYNARTLRARKKALELARGEYVWYVDADDRIAGDIDVPLWADMHVFGRMEKDGNVISHREETLTDFSVTYDMLYYVDMGCWNKFIRRELLERFMYGMEDENVVAMEDVSIIIGCLRYAKSIKMESLTVYQHLLGYSNQDKCNLDSMIMISMGHEVSMRNIRRLVEGTTFDMDRLISDRVAYYFGKIDFEGDFWQVQEMLKIVLPLFRGHGRLLVSSIGWVSRDALIRLAPLIRETLPESDLFVSHVPYETTYEDGTVVKGEWKVDSVTGELLEEPHAE